MSRTCFVALFAAVAVAVMASSSPAQIDPDLLAGMKARSIGPATMSGRIAAIDVVESDPNVIYVGSATGGLWKSTSGGLTWESIFDDQPVASIGAVAIFQRSPDIVWVGTGEANPRNSVSAGNGVYRSMDGGMTWTHLGFRESGSISRILLDPLDPDAAYVAVLGRIWGEGEERGVFKTTDGGKSWSRILFVDGRTGAADLVIDPGNPLKLFAAMWDFRRWPWFFRSGGPGSGIYVTHDGGGSWKRLCHHDGLPEGDLGRIGLAIAPSEPSIVYALVESEEIAIYRSEDGGERWSLAGKDRQVGNRPFYYADIRVDPADPNRVYSLWSIVSVSIDGARTFEPLTSFGGVHPDHHALWIDPGDPEHLINGNDGGIYISRDRGENWWFARNLPLGQFYHIRVDMDVPYNVYGGMQDNGSWKGPSAVWKIGGIRNFHWQELYYGDGFDTMPDPEDSMKVVAMMQEGYLARCDLRTGESRSIRPAPPGDVELRFNWNAALAQDPFDPGTIYYGSQFVHRSLDRGTTWSVISPDLTTNNSEWQRQDESGGLTLDVTGAENYTSLLAIAPSPLQKGLIWVGSDDGRLHVTRDGGESWVSLEKNLPGVPANTWIPQIRPSRFDPGEAFVVLDDHRRSNWTPYVYRTADFGATWTSLTTDDLFGYCLAIEQDPVKRDLLYLGTEFGLYISLNGGRSWFKWKHGLPTVSVMDLVVHPREHDLVLGTHGRSAFILDDVRPLRELSDSLVEKKIHLFTLPPAQQYRSNRAAGTRNAGTNEFRGENRPYGALITFWIDAPELPHPDRKKERERARPAEDVGGKEDKESAKEGKGPQVAIDIVDQDGETIRSFEEKVRRGVNRVVWDLRRKAFKEFPKSKEEWWRDRGGPEVLPGTYTVKVKYGELQAQGEVTVLADPRSDLTMEERKSVFDFIMRAGCLQETMADAVERIHKTRDDVDAVLARLEKDEADGEEEGPAKALIEAAGELKKSLDEKEKLFRHIGKKQDIPPQRNVRRKLGYPMRAAASSWNRPTAAVLRYMEQGEAALRAALDELNAFFEKEVSDFRKKVREAGVELLPEVAPLKMPE